MRVRNTQTGKVGHVQFRPIDLGGDYYEVWCNATQRHEFWIWWACEILSD